MGKKENRPDACTASGTASTCDYDSTSVYAGQDMTENELIRTVTEDYLADIDVDICSAPEQVERELLQATNNAIEAYNRGPRDPSAPVGASLKDAYPDQKTGDARLRLRKHLDPYQIALIVRELHHAVGILWKDAGDDGNFDIGVYQTSGDNEGTYDVSEDGLTRLIRSYDSAITIRGVYETIAVLRSVCPHVERCHDRDLIAVNNGVYDYGSKMLLGFDPEFVFTGKVRVDFVENAPNPVIHNDEDGTDWDVVSWMGELSDDESIVRLLWQIVGAVIRPGVSWNKSAWFYSTSGNNGKGTLCSLMRNLLGRGSWESISLKDFSSPFMLEPLMRISAVITDENDTGTFVDDAAALKSIITGDPFQLNRKFKEPRTVLFKGFMVQCVNELPRLRDRSESMYRRLLVVPFEKRFEGNERKYIKDDYLKRKEVLEDAVTMILRSILHDSENLMSLAVDAAAYYEKNYRDTGYLDDLEAKRREVEKSLANLVKVIESGLISETVTERLVQLEEQKRALNEAIEAENIRAALCEDEHTIKAYFEKFLHADFDNPETRDQVLEYFVDKIYLTDDGLVVTSWYSEDRTEVTWDMLYGEDGNPFVKGEAVKFDCFPFGSTTLFRACLWQALFSYETLLSYATLWWHGSLSNQVGRAKHAWRFRSAELCRRVRSDA